MFPAVQSKEESSQLHGPNMAHLCSDLLSDCKVCMTVPHDMLNQLSNTCFSLSNLRTETALLVVSASFFSVLSQLFQALSPLTLKHSIHCAQWAALAQHASCGLDSLSYCGYGVKLNPKFGSESSLSFLMAETLFILLSMGCRFDRATTPWLIATFHTRHVSLIH